MAGLHALSVNKPVVIGSSTGGTQALELVLTSLPGGQVGFLVFVNIFIFVIAFFLDFFEIAFIVIPLLAPVAAKLGIDLIWFGVLICVNMQTSFMHPPFGFALFYLRSTADSLFKAGSLPSKVLSRDIYLGSIPWVILQLMLVAIVIVFPQTVTVFLDKPVQVDLSTIRIEIPENDLQQSDTQSEQDTVNDLMRGLMKDNK